VFTKVHPTKRKILDKALELFNANGLANVTLRQIALELGISQGNLNYHFRKKEELIEFLYFELFQQGEENEKQIRPFGIQEFFRHYVSGMEQLYAYRFIITDMEQVFREVPSLRAHFISLSKFRDEAYKKAYLLGVQSGVFVALKPKELNAWAETIRLMGDNWITHAHRYGITEKAAVFENHLGYFKRWIRHYCTEAAGKELKGIVK